MYLQSMKHLKKIFFLLLVLGIASNTQAQVLSDADAKIVREMQAGILVIQSNIKNNFALQKGEEISRDTAANLIVYKAISTDNMHAAEFVITGNFKNDNLSYACAYRDEHLIKLLNIAANNMSKDVSKQWTIIKPKSDEYNVKKYMLYNKVAIASFLPNTAENELIVYFGKTEMH